MSQLITQGHDAGAGIDDQNMPAISHLKTSRISAKAGAGQRSGRVSTAYPPEAGPQSGTIDFSGHMPNLPPYRRDLPRASIDVENSGLILFGRLASICGSIAFAVAPAL